MIKDLVKKELIEPIKNSLGPEFLDFDLIHPQNDTFGDFTLSVALKASKVLKQPSLMIAEKLSRQIQSKTKLFEKVEVAPPGFLNLTVKSEYLIEEIKVIAEKGNAYGQNNTLSDKKFMVEFAHPNTHKEVHIGHLRNLSLGESLVRLQEALGAAVIRANYQGDVGLHVAKALWGIINSSKLKDQSAKLEDEPLLDRIKFLGQCYVEGNKVYEGEGKDEVVEINKKIYAQDSEIIEVWKKTRAWSLEYFDHIYALLGSRFDRFYFESEVAGPGLLIAKEALRSRILTESEGAVIFDGTPYGLDKRVFLNSQGLPTYEAKELGLASLEFSQFGEIDRCTHVVGPEQQSFFKVTFKVEELIDSKKYTGKQYHFAYGYVQLKEGKMSSRKGNIITALSVIEKAKEEIRKLIKSGSLTVEEEAKVIEIVAVGAVKYSMLRGEARNDIAFDLKESIALEGNSGPYLQYAYARARSVLRKSETLEKVTPGANGGEEGAIFKVEELALLRTLYKFPEVVETAALNYQPHLICNFLFDLAQKFNSFYNNVPILEKSRGSRIKSQGESSGGLNSESLLLNSNFRLALTLATSQVLKNGLYLLGIEAPERM